MSMQHVEAENQRNPKTRLFDRCSLQDVNRLPTPKLKTPPIFPARMFSLVSPAEDRSCDDLSSRQQIELSDFFLERHGCEKGIDQVHCGCLHAAVFAAAGRQSCTQ